MSHAKNESNGSVLKGESGMSHLGVLALTLWGLGLVCTVLDSIFAYDRIRVLVLMGGLIMIDIASAVFVSWIWFFTKHYIRPQTESQVIQEYYYRAGLRDGAAAQRTRHELRLVKPFPPQRPARGYFAADDNGQADSM